MGLTLPGDRWHLLPEALPIRPPQHSEPGLRKTTNRVLALFPTVYIKRMSFTLRSWLVWLWRVASPKVRNQHSGDPAVPSWRPANSRPRSTTVSPCSAQAFCGHQVGNLKFKFGPQRKDLGWRCKFGTVILRLIIRNIYLILLTLDIVTS